MCVRLYDGGGKLYINDIGLEWVDFGTWMWGFFIWKSAVVDRVHSLSQSQISLQMEAVQSDFLFETLILAMDNFLFIYLFFAVSFLSKYWLHSITAIEKWHHIEWFPIYLMLTLWLGLPTWFWWPFTTGTLDGPKQAFFLLDQYITSPAHLLAQPCVLLALTVAGLLAVPILLTLSQKWCQQNYHEETLRGKFKSRLCWPPVKRILQKLRGSILLEKMITTASCSSH